MTYVDGFVLPVKKKNIAAYRKMAKDAGKVWKKHGALEYFECTGDDLYPSPNWGATHFPKISKARPNETVVFSFIVFKSKAHRNSVNTKVMKEFEKRKSMPKEMPFDMKRVAYGGFKAIVEE